MISVRPNHPARPGAARRGQLLAASRLGRAAAEADLADDASGARAVTAQWRRLRRHLDVDARRVLRVAFDAAYGQRRSESIIGYR